MTVEDVEVPKVGKVDKKVVAAVAIGAAGFIGYRYWQAKRTGDTAAPDDAGATVSEFDDSGEPGTVLGAVSPNNSYGIPAGDSGTDSDSDLGFKGTTNDAWTQYAAAQLAQSDRWSYTDVVEALGNYLAQRPTTTAQQSIVNAAIAVAGQPPVGTHTLVSGGNVALTVKPVVSKVTTTETTAKIYFSHVPGAASYRAYRGVGSNVATSVDSPLTVAGLQPDTAYEFSVRGVTASGKLGPQSATMKARTKAKPKTTTTTKK